VEQALDRLVEREAETKMARTTASPASFSARNERRKKAMPSGRAVSASPTLWIRSARRATDPDKMKIANCTPAASPRTARLIETVLTPSLERMIDGSTSPCEWP
jgi:hypothetical protein